MAAAEHLQQPVRRDGPDEHDGRLHDAVVRRPDPAQLVAAVQPSDADELPTVDDDGVFRPQRRFQSVS